MKKLITITALILVAFITYSLILSKQSKNDNGKYSKDSDVVFELYMDMYYNGALIVYASGNENYTEKYKEFAAYLKNNFRRADVKVKADTSVTIDEVKNKALFLIGTVNSNRLIKQLNDKFPVRMDEHNMVFDETNYSDPRDMITFIIPNPLNKKKLLYVHSGNNDKFVSAKAKFELISDLLIRRGNQTLVMASFSYDKDNNYKIDKAHTRNFNHSTKTVLETKNYKYVLRTDGFDNFSVDKVDKSNEKYLKRFKDFFNGEVEIPKVTVNIYSNFEDKGLITLNTTLAHIDEDENALHVIINDWISGNDFTKNALLYLRKNFGKAKSSFLERGFAIYFSGNWRGKGYKYWAARLMQSGNVPSLSNLFDEKKSTYESDFLIEPLSGAFVNFMIGKIGKDEFISRYSAWFPDENELNNLEKEWHEYLQELVGKYEDEIKRDRKNFKTEVPAFMKGFNFAHEGYEIHNGYLSRTAYQSLQKLTGLNVNSIAVNPFTSMRDEKKFEPLAFWRSPHTENDQSMIYLSHVAKELGLTLIMKPHIYLHRSWPGGIEMGSEKEWDKFIDGYYRWIRHYAILSEMYQIPVLCVGNELVNATLQNEERWIKLFDDIRKIYSGKIVYGANWGKEFEELSFWNHLDYIGISNYYPLSKKDAPSDEDLLKGANEVLDKIEKVARKYNKPVIFTEAGFRSSGAPWKSSFESEIERRDTSFVNQLRAYDSFMKAAYKRDWLAGIFWWKWPSYLEHGGDPHRDLYTPSNKPAEKVVKEWYGKQWRKIHR